MRKAKAEARAKRQKFLEHIPARLPYVVAFEKTFAKSVVSLQKEVRPGSKRFERIASGVLLEFEKYEFLCTARHALDHFEGDRLLPTRLSTLCVVAGVGI
jgi:hypothetical protein